MHAHLEITGRHREAFPERDDEAIRETLLAMADDELDEVLSERELEDLRYGYRERVTDVHLPHVADLPPAPAEPDDGCPARWLLVDRLGDEPLTPGSAAAEDLVAHLEAQQPPFAPDSVEVTDDGVLVGFDYVSSSDAVVSDATT